MPTCKGKYALSKSIFSRFEKDVRSVVAVNPFVTNHYNASSLCIQHSGLDAGDLCYDQKGVAATLGFPPES